MNCGDFIDTLLPGNYALTKSMELTKVKTSGTLWYTKKFLVLYYYVFLSREIETREYINNVINSFDKYISSLAPEAQGLAEAFFYPEDEAVNFKSDKFIVFSEFAGKKDFKNQKEKNKYYENARKLYFTLLMDSGGQSGVKRIMKNAIKEKGFVYSEEAMRRIIFRAAVAALAEVCNSHGAAKDNSVKYILSEEAVAEAEKRAGSGETLTFEAVEQIAVRFPKKCPIYSGIERDMVAFIRNERKLLFYYGYFHSKSLGAEYGEFSSLTPVGEAALNANSIEFLALWEHQKIKMISQPPAAVINDINAAGINPEKFMIGYTPYTDILGYILRNKELSIPQYRLIVSRKKRCFKEDEWERGEADLTEGIRSIEKAVASFKRKSDIKDDDARKELLKYTLGLRGDLPFDKGTNPLNALEYSDKSGKKVTCRNNEELSALYNTYKILDGYKIEKYGELFEECEADLRERYISSYRGEKRQYNPKIKINWDLYNIHIDKFILLTVSVMIAAVSKKIYSIEAADKKDADEICGYCSGNFKELFKLIGLKNEASVKKEVLKVINALKSMDYSGYIQVDEDRTRIEADYTVSDVNDLLEKIKAVSLEATVSNSEGRIRKRKLAAMLKAYYIQRFTQNGKLRCECCGKEAFITQSGEPYVEYHHLIPFNIAFGPDHYLNLFALCPDCHRKIHFLNLEDKKKQYDKLNSNNYFEISFVERLMELKGEKLLRSYHLEYLLADRAISQEEYNKIAA